MKLKGIDWFAIISLAFLGILSLVLTIDQNLGLQFAIAGEEFINSFKNVTDPVTTYWVTFISTLIANLTVFIYIPYGVLIVIFATMNGVQPILLAFSGGIGAAIGEISSYIAGRLGYKIAEKKRKYRRQLKELRVLFESHPKVIPLLIYLMGATPMPDDLLLVPLGLVNYPLIKSVIPCFLGKFTMMLVLAYAGALLGSAVQESEHVSAFDWVDDMLVLILLVIIVWAAFRVNFGEIVKKITGEENISVFIDEDATKDIPQLKKDLTRMFEKNSDKERKYTIDEINDILVVPDEVAEKALEHAAQVEGCNLTTNEKGEKVLVLEPNAPVKDIVERILKAFSEYINTITNTS